MKTLPILILLFSVSINCFAKDDVYVDDAPIRPGDEISVSMEEDELVKLGRVTDWKQEEQLTLGLGQHLYALNDLDKGILEIREMIITTIDT